MIDEATGQVAEAQVAADEIRALAGWAQLPAATRARLDAIRLFHAAMPAGERCGALAAEQAATADPAAKRLLALSLAACWRGVVEHSQADALQNLLGSAEPGEFDGDPALLRLRAQAQLR